VVIVEGCGAQSWGGDHPVTQAWCKSAGFGPQLHSQGVVIGEPPMGFHTE